MEKLKTKHVAKMEEACSLQASSMVAGSEGHVGSMKALLEQGAKATHAVEQVMVMVGDGEARVVVP